LRWRVPDGVSPGKIELALPASCQQLLADGSIATLPNGLLFLQDRSLRLRCASSLAGETLRLSGLGQQLSEVVGMATLRDGTALSHLFTVASPSWRLWQGDSARRISAEYVSLGLRHILSGADHLLFLLLLVLSVRRLRGILLAETAFTL